MSSTAINTARFNSMVAVDALNQDQLLAVRKLRRLATINKVSPYTIGAFVNRAPGLERISDAERLVKLSPASREAKIADFREATEPYEPVVVAVWSAWCDQNGVDPFAVTHATPSPPPAPRAPDVQPAPEGTWARGVASPPRPVTGPIKKRGPKSKSASYERKAGPYVIERLRGQLADGKEHAVAELEETWGGGNRSTLYAAASRLGVERSYGWGPRGGRTGYWRLPASAMSTPETVEPQDVPGRIIQRTMGYPEREKLALVKIRRFGHIARRYSVATSTLARWADMKVYGNLIPGTRVLPDRESDEGIELADEVFQACMPFSPEAINSRGKRLGLL